MQPSLSQPTPDLQDQTERWTSPLYAVQFAHLEQLQAPADDEDDIIEIESAFHLSAWGISEGLYSLLRDYGAHTIHTAARWLVMQQNALVLDVIQQMKNPYSIESNLPPLDELFISIPNELYLPRGLRMIVTCVTNIVPHTGTANDHPRLDKFVAILDPGETRSYIQERKQPLSTHQTTYPH